MIAFGSTRSPRGSCRRGSLNRKPAKPATVEIRNWGKGTPGNAREVYTAVVLNPAGEQVGHAQASRVRGMGESYCVDDVRSLESQVGRSTRWVLWRSGLNLAYRGQGYGVAMYERLLRQIHADFDKPAILFPERCMEDGETSVEAERIWDSLPKRWVSVGDAVSSVPLKGSPNRKASKPARVSVIHEDHGFMVIAWVDGKNIGDLMIRTRSAETVSDPCVPAFQDFAREVGANPRQVMIVRQAEIDRGHRFKGIGERMYRLAARVAARNYNQLLGSDSVLWTGTTSSMAKNVWSKIMKTRFRHRSCGGENGFFVWGGR